MLDLQEPVCIKNDEKFYVILLLTISHRKCDEAKPYCNNCISANKKCEGYQVRVLFDTDINYSKERGGRLARKQSREERKAGKVQKQTAPQGGHQIKTELGDQIVKSLGITKPEAHISLIDGAHPQLHPALSLTLQKPHPSHHQDSLHQHPQHAPHLGNLDGSTDVLTPDSFHLDPKALTNLEHFSSKLFENLEVYLQSPNPSQLNEALQPGAYQIPEEAKSPLSHVFEGILSTQLATSQSATSQESLDGYANLDNEIIHFIDKANVFDGRVGEHEAGATSLDVPYQQENMMLKHFFKKLLPLLDAHPLSPWPDLALKYCDFDVARSCFISLACIHIYESRKGGNEYYRTGMAHINSTMNYLIQYISRTLDTEVETSNEGHTKKQIRSFVILVLINVHILFAVLEKGKSSLSRYLFKVFGSVCQEQQFYQSLTESQSKRTLVFVLSWYDTVCAIVSPDCRLPYCNPEWYGTCTDDISTMEMMGCPGEIFKAMSQVCYLRHEIHRGFMEDDAVLKVEVEGIKQRLLKYRDYVDFKDGKDYNLRLKGAQCWSLAVYASLLRLFKTPERQKIITAVVHEFIDVYGSMPSESPTVTQMVWPVYAIGCECITQYERSKLHQYMDTLYETAQMGTLDSLRWIVLQVWEQGKTQEEILEQWLDKGVDYLPL